MKVHELRKLLNFLPVEYENSNVYYSTDFKWAKNPEIASSDFDPEALTDIDEFVVDVSDGVIVLRGQID